MAAGQSGVSCWIQVSEVVPVLQTLIHAATEQSIELDGLQVIDPTLEDVYLKLVETQADDSTSGDATEEQAR